MSPGPSELSQFVGSFHVVLVHLPIGFLVLLAALELASLSPRYRAAAAGSGIILALTLPAVLFTAGCGWLLAQGDGYHADLLAWHEWTGFGVAAAVVLVAVAHRMGRVLWYRILLAVALVLVVVAGHAGGALTHGQDFLIRHAPWRAAALSAAPATAGKAQPVFQKYCVSCHGPEKAKGDLRLDAPDLVLDGAVAAQLVQRLRLPLAHDDHMPPAGKPQPTPAEVETVAAWSSSLKK